MGDQERAREWEWEEDWERDWKSEREIKGVRLSEREGDWES